MVAAARRHVARRGWRVLPPLWCDPQLPLVYVTFGSVAGSLVALFALDQPVIAERVAAVGAGIHLGGGPRAAAELSAAAHHAVVPFRRWRYATPVIRSGA